MLAAMTHTDIQSKLAEYEGIIRMLTAKVEELVADNERLTSALTAHQTLRAIYSDSNQPANVRVRAAQAAIGHESAPLKATEAPLDLVAEPIESLADVITRQRARADKMLREDPQFQALRNSGYLLDSAGNGSNDSSSNDHS